jgi:hypothetical protein
MAEKTTRTEETTTEESLIDWQVWLAAAVALGAAAGAMFAWRAGKLTGLEGPLASFIPFVLCVSGVLIGAGVGLALGDYRRTKTEKVTTVTEGEAAGLATPGEAVITESFKVLKDLTPGKTLIVLGVALIGMSLWAVTPAKPSTEVTVQTP